MRRADTPPTFVATKRIMRRVPIKTPPSFVDETVEIARTERLGFNTRAAMPQDVFEDLEGIPSDEERERAEAAKRAEAARKAAKESKTSSAALRAAFERRLESGLTNLIHHIGFNKKIDPYTGEVMMIKVLVSGSEGAEQRSGEKSGSGDGGGAAGEQGSGGEEAVYADEPALDEEILDKDKTIAVLDGLLELLTCQKQICMSKHVELSRFLRAVLRESDMVVKERRYYGRAELAE